jgi:hypothetical protein
MGIALELLSTPKCSPDVCGCTTNCRELLRHLRAERCPRCTRILQVGPIAQSESQLHCDMMSPNETPSTKSFYFYVTDSEANGFFYTIPTVTNMTYIDRRTPGAGHQQVRREATTMAMRNCE